VNTTNILDRIKHIKIIDEGHEQYTHFIVIGVYDWLLALSGLDKLPDPMVSTEAINRKLPSQYR
jgi:hypothetical protein